MDTKKSISTQTHILGLDSLRAIAIIGVVLYHLFPSQVKGGYLGVLLFFVLSGYLITYTCERDLERNQFSIFIFYLKRIKRIYFPLFVMVFTVAGVLHLFVPTISGLKSGELLSIFGGYNNIWQIMQNASYFSRISNVSPFTHLWSLSIELQFYLIWPFLFLSIKKLPSKGKYTSSIFFLIWISLILALLMSCLYQPDTDVSRLYYGTDTRIFSLFLGSATAMLQKQLKDFQKPDWFQKFAYFCFAFILGLILLFYIFLDGQSGFLYQGGMLFISFMFCALLLLVTDASLPFGQWLDIRPLSYIGKESYEIYLWQYPVIFLFSYQKWNGIGFLLLKILLIGLLSAWLYQFTYIIRNYFWKSRLFLFSSKALKSFLQTKGNFMKQIKKLLFIVMSFVLVPAFFVGGCSSLSSNKKTQTVSGNLEQELEANTKMLEEQQASASVEDKNTAVSTESDTEINTDTFTAIGDSVMLGAAQEIKNLFPESIVDAKESRQVVQAKSILEELDSNNQLNSTVIVALGTNGPFSTEKGQELIDYLGSNRTIFWITAYGEHLQWQDESNDIIQALAEQNENVTVIDWASYAASHPEWFYNDGIHLNADGRSAYANLIKEVLNEKN